jgi:hypothetical protein
MFIDGLSDWEKRRLALILKERGQTAFMVIKHATAAVMSAKRHRQINPVDQQYLDLLDATIEELYGYHRLPNELSYAEPDQVKKIVNDDNSA